MWRGRKELDKVKTHFTFNALLVAPMSDTVVGMESQVWRSPGVLKIHLLNLPRESAVPLGFTGESLSSWRHTILRGL